MNLEEILSLQIGANTGLDYGWAIIIFFGTILILKLFQVIILVRLKKLALKTKTDFDDILIEIFTRIKPPFYLLVALFIAIKSLTFPEVVGNIIKVIFLVVIVYEIIRAIERMVEYFVTKYFDGKGRDKQASAMANISKFFVRFGLWLIGLILILSNLGIDVTSLVASLGIGGLAIALALQNVLSDMFASFSIYIDKPFEVGDFIAIGTDKGTVEKIGLKTTRLTTLQGEEMVISNQELTSARVQNFKKMKERRISFNIGVVYGTTATKLRAIPKLVKEAIGGVKDAKFDRCSFSSFGDFSLNFTIVYYIKSGDYGASLDAGQKINIDIYRTFEKEGIEFAYPTQTVIVNKEEK